MAAADDDFLEFVEDINEGEEYNPRAGCVSFCMLSIIIKLNELHSNEPGTRDYLNTLNFNNINTEVLKSELNEFAQLAARTDGWNVQLAELIDLAAASYTQRNDERNLDGGRKYRRRRSRKYRKHRLSRNPRKSIRRRRTVRRSI